MERIGNGPRDSGRVPKERGPTRKQEARPRSDLMRDIIAATKDAKLRRELLRSDRPNLKAARLLSLTPEEHAAKLKSLLKLLSKLPPELRALVMKYINKGPGQKREMLGFLEMLSQMFSGKGSMMDALIRGPKKQQLTQKMADVKAEAQQIHEELAGQPLDRQGRELLLKLSSALSGLSTTRPPDTKLKPLIATLIQVARASVASDSGPDGLPAQLRQLVAAQQGLQPQTPEQQQLLRQLQTLGFVPQGAQSASPAEVQVALQQLTQMQQDGTALPRPMREGPLMSLLENAQQLFSQEASRPQLAAANLPPMIGGAEALLGPHTRQIGPQMTSVIEQLQLALSPGAVTLDGPKLTESFEKAVLGGILLGRLIADHGSRHGRVEDASTHPAALKMAMAKQLGVVDQIPFSLLAFSPPLQYHGGGSADVKAAFDALRELIQLLLQFVFVLSAALSVRERLGPDGSAVMLRENQGIFIYLVDGISERMLKIRALFGVNVETELMQLAAVGKGLAKQDYPLFWENALAIVSHESILKDFLQEFETAEPLFKSIKSMLQLGGQDVPFYLSA